TRNGGTLELVQLWVNLPAAHKMTPPAYQAITARQIPTVELPNAAGSARIIAGEYLGWRGPARTFTPVDLWDLRLRGDREIELRIADGQTAALVVLRGSVRINRERTASDAQVVLYERAGNDISVATDGEATLLLLGGQPIDEPIVGYGPFVMNSRAEIEQALRDFRSGRF
ncbi:MAG: pirin family protein, partial [Steroidobacteraceae bacterium]|nr:pirin family protein [Steroidobacteraceae bacterium]